MGPVLSVLGPAPAPGTATVLSLAAGVGEENDVAASLASVARDLGPSTLSVACAPVGDHMAVGRCVIYDPTDPPAIDSGDIALLVGVRGATAVTLGAMNDCALSGAAAVAVKGVGGDLSTVVQAAHSAGIAVLAVPDDISWGTLHTLVRAALQTAGPAATTRRASPLEHLFQLANQTAASTGGHCAITDDRLIVIAYSSLAQSADSIRLENILGRRDTAADEKFRREGAVRAFLSGKDLIRFEPPDGSRARLTVPIRAGDEFLGVVSIIEPESGAEACREALVGAAQLAVAHMLRHIAFEEQSRHVHDELLRSVLSGRSVAQELARELGLPVEGEWVVVGFLPCGDVRWRRPGGEQARAKHLVSIALAAYSPHSLVVDSQNEIYAVIPVTRSSDRQSVHGLVDRLLRQVCAETGIEVGAALGPTVDGLARIQDSRAEVDQVLPILTVRSTGCLAELSEVRNELVLSRLRQLVSDEPDLVSGLVDVLTDLEDQHGVGYVATVRAFLDAFGDVSAAAAALFVHPNTLRYRLRRIKETCGLDLTDPDERFVLDFQLRMKGL